jgi:hypothetical protein
VDAGELDRRCDGAAAGIARRLVTETRVTIAVEWDNARLSEADRSIRLLEQLDLQVREVERQATCTSRPAGSATATVRQVEIVVCYNETEIERTALADLLRRHLTVPWRLEGTRDCEYYELKNHAARVSSGDLLVFVDSDVIPEPGWLDALLSCFDRQEVDVACGSTYIDPTTLLGKAFGLFWFYPLRQRQPDMRQTRAFFANNLAFRRRTFDRFPFPTAHDTSRGACLALAEQLDAVGVSIWCNGAARVSHPPPNGLRHFITRGLAQGRDRFLREQSAGSLITAAAGIVGRLARNLGRSARDIASGYHEVGAAVWQLPAIALIAGGYYGLFFCGEVATVFRPSWMTRHLRI